MSKVERVLGILDECSMDEKVMVAEKLTNQISLNWERSSEWNESDALMAKLMKRIALPRDPNGVSADVVLQRLREQAAAQSK